MLVLRRFKALFAVLIFLIILIAVFLKSSASVHAAGVYYVQVGSLDSNDCGSPDFACGTINRALAVAAAGDEIRVSVGIYTASNGVEVVNVAKSIHLRGGWSIDFAAQTGVSTIDGQDMQRGMSISSGPVFIDHFIFTRGKALNGGGLRTTADVLITYSAFYANHVLGVPSSGGGVQVDFPGTLSAVNTTFAGNSADLANNGLGGAIYAAPQTSVNLASVTIGQNSAERGGGIYQGNNSAISLHNTLIAGNTGIPTNPSDCDGTFVSFGYNLIGNVSPCTLTGGSGDLTGTGASPLNPSFDPYSNGVLAIRRDSPAIDKGDPNGCKDTSNMLLATDQIGQPRTMFGRCDIGAYESQYPYATSTPFGAATATRTNTPTPSKTSTATATRTATVTPRAPDTIGFYNRNNSTFYLRNSNTPGTADIIVTVGDVNSYPVVGDWDGDGFDTVGIYNQQLGFFTLYDSNVQGASFTRQFIFGNPNDIPLSGRWVYAIQNDGVGRYHDGVGVFRPSNGLIYLASAWPGVNQNIYADYTIVLGNPGWLGLAGKWNGGALDTAAVYEPDYAHFWMTNQSCNGTPPGNNVLCLQFSDNDTFYGIVLDRPFKGDWTGIGQDGIGIYRLSNGTFYLKNVFPIGSKTISQPDSSVVFGITGSNIPVSGHWKPLPPTAPKAAVPAPIITTATPEPVESGRFD